MSEVLIDGGELVVAVGDAEESLKLAENFLDEVVLSVSAPVMPL